MKVTDFGLYLVTDQRLSKGRTTPEVVRQAIAGGAKTIQLREKGMPARDMVELGREIRRITLDAKVTFLINDRADIALLVEADGVHLGQDDLSIEDARRLLGDEAVIGVSVDTVEEAIAAEQMGVNYIALGPVFSTSTKTDTGPVTGLRGLSLVREQVKAPLVAIGGINRENAEQVLRAGADSLAIITGLTAEPDITLAARELSEMIAAVRS